MLLFICLAASDWLDGYLARKLNQVSDLGKFLDPLADKILIIVALLVLVELGKVSSVPVMIIVIREFLVMGLRVHTGGKGIAVAASFSAKWKTVLQLLAVFMLVCDLPYAAWILWLAVIVTVWSGVEYFYEHRGVW